MSKTTSDDLDIAIIGMAGRFPGAKDVDELWANLRDGVESIRFFTEEECRAAGVDSALLADPSFVRAAALPDDIEGFDASFFDITPREAELMDPQHRIFLECASAALEHAGYSPQQYQGSIGVYGGATLSTYLLYHLVSNPRVLAAHHPLQINIGNGSDFLTTRVSYKLGLTGPSHVVQSACSTSLVAIHVACQSLLADECDMALAGGVSIQVGQRYGYLHQEGGMASPDGHCRAFDRDAKGTIFGSGAGVIVLKRLSAAVADGDTVHAVIKGSAVNNDGSFKAGYTAPSVEGQARVIAEALSCAGVSPDTIGYVEAHGTGTPLGDPVEIEALSRAYRAAGARRRHCAIGSLKTNIGHLDAAAGAAGVIKSVQSLRHAQIAPSLHFTQPNPAIDFEDSPFYVNTTLRPWPDPVRRAAVSSFGVGGTNAHLILEQAAKAANAPEDGVAHPWQLLVLSAKTETALAAASEQLARHLEAHATAHLPDIAHTLRVGRNRYAHRRFVVCDSAAGAAAALRAPSALLPPRASDDRRAVTFMFPGQGAQRVDMGVELYRSAPAFRAAIDRAATILAPHIGLDLRALLYPLLYSRLDPALDGKSEPAARLTQTSLAQPALFAVEYALAKLWMSWGVHPESMIGHSVGEYVAACLAGVFSLEDALALIAARGRLVQSLPAGAMLAVPLAEDELMSYLDVGAGERLSLAAHNGPFQCVVSGDTVAIDDAERTLAAAGVSCRRLATSHAFHSAMMDPILEAFADRVGAVTLSAPSIPFVSNVTGTWITKEQATSPAYWARHLRETVRFGRGIETLATESPRRIWLEVGPGRTLARFVGREHTALSSLAAAPAPTQASTSTLAAPGEMRALLTAAGELWRAGVPFDWTRFTPDEPRKRVPLPTYPFERRRHWIARRDAPAAIMAADPADPVDPTDPIPPIEPIVPKPAAARPELRNAYAAPATALERTLVALWEAALGVAPIGVQDSFFDLGGDSLAAVQLGARIKRELHVDLPVAGLYEGLTVQALAVIIEAQTHAESASAQSAPGKLGKAAPADPSSARTGLRRQSLQRLRARKPDGALHDGDEEPRSERST